MNVIFLCLDVDRYNFQADPYWTALWNKSL